jgi:hypothetical protein
LVSKEIKKFYFQDLLIVIADLMHYCDYYFDDQYVIGTGEKFKYDFENEFAIAQEYYNDEKLEEETA